MYDVYLIYGEDYNLVNQEIKNICKDYDDVIHYDLNEEKIDTLLNDASCISIFGDKKVIIGDNALFLTGSSTDGLGDYSYLEKYLLSTAHQNIVIFTVLSDKLDERKKIVKLLKNNAKVIYKEKIEEKKLPAYVVSLFKKYEYNIDLKTADYFVTYVGKNIDIIISEIEKMILYKEDEKNISIEDINNICCKALNDNVFDLCDGILKKDFKKIYSCYSDLLELKMEPSIIISIISNQFLFMYQVKVLKQEGKSSAEIAKLLNAHPYRVSLNFNTDYMVYELEDVLKKLYDLDYDIKRGKKDRFTALDTFFLNL